ncbi:hypothetical protein ECG_02993 [Echinococcus granulosus]|nr:hypothetical protein ECG_02993 [Echinococcus granulosus]
MTTRAFSNSSNIHEEDVHPLSEIMCNCELCYARLCASTRHFIEDDSMYNLDPLDNFPFPNGPKMMSTYVPYGYDLTGSSVCGDAGTTALNKMTFQGGMGLETAFPVYPSSEWQYCSKVMEQVPGEGDFSLAALSSPQLYLSKESVIHLRLSAYVVLERSGTAYRLINYRNNSALALSENCQYGYVYHFNCRGLINIHHEKLSITFDKERQILLRTEKPSFVKNENEYYRLTMHHWAQCRPVSMDFFDRDRTPDILKKSGSDKVNEEPKLLDLVNSSVIQKDASGLTIYLGDARIEQRLNGDVSLSWMHGEQLNSLVVSPLTGGLSLSTRNLEIIATPKNEIYISFADFFVHVESQQMTVSSGAISGRPNYVRGHPCLLKLVNSHAESQNLPQYCPYMNHPQSSPIHSVSKHGSHGRHEGNNPNAGTCKISTSTSIPQAETPTTTLCGSMDTEELAHKSASGCNCAKSSDTSLPSKTTKTS